MSALYVCPHCDTQWTTPDGFIAHDFSSHPIDLEED
jgi:hypothetical protein